MAIATRTNTTLAATITQANLVAALKTAFTNAGFATLYDEYTAASTNKFLVYEITADSSKTYGKIYLRVGVGTGLITYSEIFTSWDAVNHAGINGSTLNTFTAFSSSSSISFAAFNGGDEFKIVVLVQGSIVIPLGVLIPASRPSWWDLNLWPWGFVPTASNFLSWRSTAINPYTNDSYQLLSVTNSILGTANPQTNKRDVITGILLGSSSNTGIAGKTSDDLAIVCASGSSRYDTIQPTGTTQVFTILNNASGGFAVRTA
jgi:hypothetical protein